LCTYISGLALALGTLNTIGMAFGLGELMSVKDRMSDVEDEQDQIVHALQGHEKRLDGKFPCSFLPASQDAGNRIGLEPNFEP
jgi:hypothetical protein